MGGAFAKLLGRLSDRGEINIVMVGLDGAGKTTILHRFRHGEFRPVQTFPGINVERMTYENITVTSWSVGGWNMMETPWRRCLRNIHGIIFVLDSADEKQIVKARDELQRVVTEENMKDAVLLVLANKQDCPNAMSSAEITDLLGLHFYEQNWYVAGTDAFSLKGLYNGLFWLCKSIYYKVVENIGLSAGR